MIYLIGGPPKCGKTTLAKTILAQTGIPWVSTDTLQNILKPYLTEARKKDMFPVSSTRTKSNDERYSTYSPEEIIKMYRNQAASLHDAVEMFILSEIVDGNDYVIEGYHIEPAFAGRMEDKFEGQILSAFLVKNNAERFVSDIPKSRTTNDWIVKKTKNKETYSKIAEMITKYSGIIENECRSLDLGCWVMDSEFRGKIEIIIEDFGLK